MLQSNLVCMAVKWENNTRSTSAYRPGTIGMTYTRFSWSNLLIHRSKFSDLKMQVVRRIKLNEEKHPILYLTLSGFLPYPLPSAPFLFAFVHKLKRFHGCGECWDCKSPPFFPLWDGITPVIIGTVRFLGSLTWSPFTSEWRRCHRDINSLGLRRETVLYFSYLSIMLGTYN